MGCFHCLLKVRRLGRGLRGKPAGVRGWEKGAGAKGGCGPTSEKDPHVGLGGVDSPLY